MTERFDVLVVGAGISGIGAGYYLQQKCPGRSFAILEGREQLGGTWDLFRYPGIRSDSEMYTLGYGFKPWTGDKAIADGADILDYLRETAAENGIDRHIRFRHKVVSAAWCSRDSRWTVEVERAESTDRVQYTCSFLFLCSGYYNYRAGYTPEFAGREQFQGRIVHPQHWTDDIEYAGKRVVVIGSGATAVTLVPELARAASHVTMLQRSPTYIVSGPSSDALAARLQKFMPTRTMYALVRWKNVLLSMIRYWYCRKYPERARELLIDGVRQELGPEYDVERDFTPDYMPWDQRVCLVPDSDMFQAIRDGRASVVTDHIERFTEKGLLLKSGTELSADLIVTATGLDMQLLGEMALNVDGKAVHAPEHMTYKGMMISDIPNLAFAMGYTNASWTLKVDLTCAYVCRLLNYMWRHGYRQCVPRRSNDPSLQEEPAVNFTSGYIQRAQARLPKQGSKKPWKLYQNYLLDKFSMGFGRLADKAMEFK